MPNGSDTTEQLCTQNHIVWSLNWWINYFMASGSHGNDLELTVAVQSMRGPERIICRMWFQNLRLDTADHSPSWNLHASVPPCCPPTSWIRPSLYLSQAVSLLHLCLSWTLLMLQALLGWVRWYLYRKDPQVFTYRPVCSAQLQSHFPYILWKSCPGWTLSWVEFFPFSPTSQIHMWNPRPQYLHMWQYLKISSLKK